MKVLQVGLGGFGRNHIRAWHEMGMGPDLYIADLDVERHKDTEIFNVPASHVTTNYEDFLDQVDIVDIVTPSTSHFPLCIAALRAGKDVFVEKPMTMTSDEAEQLTAAVHETGRVLQVGYYYRFHPTSIALQESVVNKSLGDIRYLSGDFMGFKRARTDVGVTKTDGIHFIDLFNWLMGAPPVQVYAVVRDHFNRGLEDASVVILHYPGGAFAKIESGYIQPGKWRDKVVPNAFTSKSIYVCAESATVEVDFETEYMTEYDVHHEFKDNTWTPVLAGSSTANTSTATPVQMIQAELKDFLGCVESRTRPSADVVSSGIVLARVMEAIYQSGSSGVPVDLKWSTEESNSLRPESIHQPL